LDGVHILVKTIREQAAKQPKKSDPPAWTRHLCKGVRVEKAIKTPETEEKRDDGSRKTACTVDTSEETMVAQDAPSTQLKLSEQEEMQEVAAKAQREIDELEALLAKQEEDAKRLAGKAAQIIAQLEAEANEKAKAAEEALRKAKEALSSVDENVKRDLSLFQSMVESAIRGEDISEDREVASPISFTREVRQEHCSEDNEVSAINHNEVDIAEPPTIVRKGKSLTIVTDLEYGKEDSHDMVSPLHEYESPRKRVSLDSDGSTLDTIYKKIEECQETLLNPDASMDDQSKAAELMAKMARIAKITESLEPKKQSPPDVISPLSCANTVDASQGEKSLVDIQKKIEECRQTLMDTSLNISEHLAASEKMEALAKEALAASHD
jgi:hypothetical protein